MDRDEIIKRVTELDFPLGQYAIVGSGPLAVRGLRDVSDVDILVTAELYMSLRDERGWKELTKMEGRVLLEHEPFECGTEFGYGEYWPEPDMVIAEADIIDGVAFATLEVIASFKRAYGRPKDERDLLLIGEYNYEHEKEDL